MWSWLGDADEVPAELTALPQATARTRTEASKPIDWRGLMGAMVSGIYDETVTVD